MVRLREVPRTATFAWSPGSDLPLLATGTVAGAVDADFSNETQLEIWDLNLDNAQEGLELQPTASIGTDSRFFDIAWGSMEGSSRGIIAGALENGSLDFWNADKLIAKESDAFISRTSKHSGAIKALQFNPFKPELLATSGAKGEVFISDINNVENPFRLGHATGRADDFECLDWNKRVQKILATGSAGGFVTVWDAREKKENMILNNLGRKPISALAWDPSMPTRLVTAIPLDTDPLICVWDLRNSNTPERILKGHDSGVLSVSWCSEDHTILLSSGKDNRTICWNPTTGEQYGEFPVVTNWTFETRWNPHYPSLLATASFDGKIGIQTIQNTNTKGKTPGTPGATLDGEDFFSKAPTQSLDGTFSLPKAPRWLERPVGASFGFGAKIVTFTADSTEPGTKRHSKLKIVHFEVDDSVGEAATEFEKAIEEGDLGSICEKRIENAKNDDEKEDWKVIAALVSTNQRQKLVEYLGFSKTSEEADDNEDSDTAGPVPKPLQQLKVNGAGAKGHRRGLSSFFDSTHDTSLLADVAPSKTVKTNDPFKIYTGSESEAEKEITKALLLGKFDKAMEMCLKEERMADALIFAICGGQKCIDKAKAAYFSKKTEGVSYLRLLSSVSDKNLWDIVYNADLSDWKEAMVAICTFAEPKDFPDLCEALGDRLMGTAETATTSRKDASFCYIVGSKLDKVVGIWARELQENEIQTLADPDNTMSAFSIHVRALQDLIEKVTIFRKVSKFTDSDKDKSVEWKLASLYDKYIEYADVLATHGMFATAEKYLNLLPAQYAPGEVARNRVKNALQKPKVVAQAAQVTKKTTVRSHARTGSNARARQSQSVNAAFPSLQPSGLGASSTAPTNPYAVPPKAPSSYAPSASRLAYGPPQPVGQSSVAAPGPYGYPRSQSRGIAPPPGRQFTPSPSIPPPSQAANMKNWNDTPEEFFKPPVSRHSTPGSNGHSAITSPFPNQQQSVPLPNVPLGPSTFGPRHATPPVPPPPKGPAHMAHLSSPHMQAAQLDRPSSAAASHYAPPPGSTSNLGVATHMIPRGPSPYNAPPTGGPPPSRYAPAPKAQGIAPTAPQGIQPPPMAVRQAIPPNPYAPQPMQSQQPGMPVNPYMPASPPRARQSSLTQSPQLVHAIPQSTSSQQGSRPGTSQSHRNSSVRGPPPGPKYPAGDRTHIPPTSMPIYEILNSEMQRVKGIAPPSFKAQVIDTEKRLNILFDHLNREDLLKDDTIAQLVELATAVQNHDHDVAMEIHLDILTNKTEECGHWMVGVKRLIGMSRAD